MRRAGSRPVLAGLVGLALAATPVAAQGLASILGKTGLTPDDFALMDAAARDLYTAEKPEIGKQVEWSNPDSAAYGTVLLEDMADKCATILHTYHPKGADEARTLKVIRCQSADGRWLLRP